MLVNYQDYECEVRLSHFDCNKRPALCLYEADNGMPFCRATVNVPELELADDEMILDESNCPGIAEALAGAGVVSKPIRQVNYGFCKAPVVQLLWDGERAD